MDITDKQNQPTPFDEIKEIFPVGQKAILYVIDFQSWVQGQAFEDYSPKDYWEKPVIFMKHGIPYSYTLLGDGCHAVDWDIYVNGLMPLAVKQIGKMLPKGSLADG